MFEKKQPNEGKRPDYSSRDGVHIWKNQDKNGKEYLSVRIPILNISVNCFQPLEESDMKVEVEDV